MWRAAFFFVVQSYYRYRLAATIVQCAACGPCETFYSVFVVHGIHDGVTKDVNDFSSGRYGKHGYWFPGFACSDYYFEQPTNFSERSHLSSWLGPLKHIERWQLTEYANRTFSMDGPCSVICGDSDYAVIILPDGSAGGSGIVVDPAADENSNNSVNKIQLDDGVPSEFILSIIVDN